MPPLARRWALLPAVTAPVALIGGWTLAAALRPDDFSSVRDTISALAAVDAPNREIMTAGLALLGLSHVGTALALRGAATPGRVVLAVGGVASALVAAFPLPDGDGGSAAHGLAAGVGFACLTVVGGPGGAGRARRRPGGCAGARRVAATVVLPGLVGWFAVELVADTARVGISSSARRRGHSRSGRWPSC